TQAQQFAPEGIFQPVDEEATARVRQSLLSTLHRLTPDVAAGDDPGCAFLRLDRLTLRWPDRSRLLAEIACAVEGALSVSRAIGGLQAISRPAFRRQFGIKALDVYDLAFGIDHRDWRPFKPPVRIQAAEPLDPPIDNTEALQFIARALAERISTSLLTYGLG